jgi:hypothetical protein
MGSARGKQRRVTLDPAYDPRSVFFVGNGVLRVPSRLISRDGVSDDEPLPSWNEYMERLWQLAGAPRDAPRSAGLTVEQFLELSAPRQAEWFDRRVRADPHLQHEGLPPSALRLHLLGKTLHRKSGILTNDLLGVISTLVLQPIEARRADRPSTTVDVVTTNLDCSLEQNLAWQAERLLFARRPLRQLTIDVIVGMEPRPSTTWRRRDESGEGTATIRLWKLHGCLRHLRLAHAAIGEKILAWEKRLAGGSHGDPEEPFAGHVPIERLSDHALAGWRAAAGAIPTASEISTGVFSISEYLNMVDQLSTSGAVHGGDASRGRFRSLLEQRPFVFVGYSLAEEDFDVVAALHRCRPATGVRRWMLREGYPGGKPSEAERLEQMGIGWWGFELPPVGRTNPPSSIRPYRLEWRLAVRSTARRPARVALRQAEEAWRRQLQAVSSRAWLRPQVEKLAGWCLPQFEMEPEARHGRRLVVAGLGSIWHGFSLYRSADFPTQRRASARFMAVDSQVPGGSGLVPLLIAAAIGGPHAVGRLSYFSNVPRQWSGWREIETLCLSAGVAVFPASAKEGKVGRTSHVLLFDQQGDDGSTPAPRQRFIMDVQSMADGALPPADGEQVSVGKAALPTSRHRHRYDLSDGDLLFADKEVAPKSLRDWPGPVIYETGATGIELTEPSVQGAPSVWTAGIGSFVRTLAYLAGWPENAQGRHLPELLRSHPQVERVLRCSKTLQKKYLERLCGFGTSAWKGGFRHQDETAFGRELLRRWHDLAPTIGELLGLLDPHDEIWLKCDVWGVGRGVLVTVHEAGLMALWERGGSLQSIAVEIVAVAGGEALRFQGTSASGPAGRRSLPLVELRVLESQIELAFEGRAQTIRLRSDRRRRNTLGAGDAVRGALAFGLWRLADTVPEGHEPERDLAQIVQAAAVLASIKCYAGSFIDFLGIVTQLRTHAAAWRLLWPTRVRS